MGSYAPEAPPITLDAELQEYLQREFSRIGDAVQRTSEVVLTPTNVAPTKPEEGSIIYADGVNFNPGAGEGAYLYVNGVWVKLSATASDLADAILTPFIGCIIDFGGAEADIPPKFIPPFGQSLLRAGQYAPLFAKYGTIHGSVDGTHFNVPDYRGRASAGKDNMGGTSANRLTGLTEGVDGDILGGTGGLQTQTLTVSHMPAHAHTTGTSTAYASGVPGIINTSVANGQITGTRTHISDTEGLGFGHNNVQPTIIVNKIIYAGA